MDIGGDGMGNPFFKEFSRGFDFGSAATAPDCFQIHYQGGLFCKGLGKLEISLEGKVSFWVGHDGKSGR